MTLPPQRLLTLDEVAERFGWSKETIVKALKSHGIGTIGRGRLRRLTEDDVAQLIEAERQYVPVVAREPRGRLKRLLAEVREERDARNRPELPSEKEARARIQGERIAAGKRRARHIRALMSVNRPRDG